LPDIAKVPMSEPESELMWSLHGSIFYIGIRVSVYGVAPPSDIPGAVTLLVKNFYESAQIIMRPKVSSRTAKSARKRNT